MSYKKNAQKKKTKKHPPKNGSVFFRRIKILILIVSILMTIDVGLYIFTPKISQLKNKAPCKSAFMAQREETAQLSGKHLRIKRKWVNYTQISPYLIKAVIISEDDKFWQHNGFDFQAIKRAFERNIEEKRFKFGASTITQQLARNLYLSPSKNPLRKLKEAILTIRLERNLSKKRILELYLNFAEWGKGVFGIEAASHHYYGKSAARLTPMQAARLASVLPNPRRFNPKSNSKFVRFRSSRIYKIMRKRGL